MLWICSIYRRHKYTYEYVDGGIVPKLYMYVYGFIWSILKISKKIKRSRERRLSLIYRYANTTKEHSKFPIVFKQLVIATEYLFKVYDVLGDV